MKLNTFRSKYGMQAMVFSNPGPFTIITITAIWWEFLINGTLAGLRKGVVLGTMSSDWQCGCLVATWDIEHITNKCRISHVMRWGTYKTHWNRNDYCRLVIEGVSSSQVIMCANGSKIKWQWVRRRWLENTSLTATEWVNKWITEIKNEY